MASTSPPVRIRCCDLPAINLSAIALFPTHPPAPLSIPPASFASWLPHALHLIFALQFTYRSRPFFLCLAIALFFLAIDLQSDPSPAVARTSLHHLSLLLPRPTATPPLLLSGPPALLAHSRSGAWAPRVSVAAPLLAIALPVVLDLADTATEFYIPSV